MVINYDGHQRLLQLLMVVLLFCYHNSIRLRHRLTRPAIVSLRESPWQKLYNYADATSFLHMTGLTQECFHLLLADLFDLEVIARLRGRHSGRPRSLGQEGYLGLLLFYFGSTMSYKHLCLIFGIMPSVCSRVIRDMLRLVICRLSNHPIAQDRFPDPQKMQQFAEMVQRRAPIVSDVIGFIDGVSIPSECTDERVEQNVFYCGYDCDMMVYNVFAYGPDGKVFFCDN